MRKGLTESLNYLLIDFHILGGHIIESARTAMRSFVNQDIDLAEYSKNNDKIVNKVEMDIEQKCVQLIALQAPVTSDLRKIIALMKASSNLERIGDHSKSIAKATIRTSQHEPDIELLNKLLMMSEYVIETVELALDSYVQNDESKAKEVGLLDDTIDEMRNLIRDEAIQTMMASPKKILVVTEYIQIANYLERIADHAVNVAELTLYIKKGEIIDLD